MEEIVKKECKKLKYLAFYSCITNFSAVATFVVKLIILKRRLSCWQWSQNSQRKKINIEIFYTALQSKCFHDRSAVA